MVAVDGAPVTRFRQIERALAGRDEVLIKLIRSGAVIDEVVRTEALSPLDVERVVLWAGLRIHAPHRAALLHGIEPSRPYISWWNGGSPAGRAKLYPRRSILEVAGQDIPDLQTFLEVIAQLPAGAPIRVVVQDQDQEREVLTLEPNGAFWPTQELVWEQGRWIRRALPEGSLR